MKTMIMMINRKVLKCFFPVLIIILYSGMELAEANLNYKDLRDPFHSIVRGDKKPGEESAENDEEEIQGIEGIAGEERKVKLELIEEKMSEKLEKIEISGFFGENKKFFVLFKGDSRIYKEKDRLNTDKKIKIHKIDVDMVTLIVNLKNGKRLSKKILFKIK